jgi:DNA-binding transcriptional LysR family regulator
LKTSVTLLGRIVWDSKKSLTKAETMTIKRLKTLVAIADTDTFNAAADQVHVTHAAVSQQMRTLEADLGVSLFDRSTRTPELTPIARQIVTKARRLIRDYDTLVPSVLDDGGLSGSITLGAMPTTLTGLAPRALSILKTRVPQIGLHIRPGLTRSLLADVERGGLDAAIVSKPHRLPVGLVFRDLAREPMQLIAGLDATETDPIALLAGKPFIRFNRGAVVGTLIDNWILSKRIRVSETMELDSLEAITSMVHQNLGVSIVPRLAVAPQGGPTVKRLSLGKDAPERILGIAHREDQVKTRAIDELFNALMSVIQQAQTQE